MKSLPLLAPTPPPPRPDLIPLSWPPDGVLSRDWLQNLADVFTWASRHLSPSDFPSLLPLPVLQRLLLTASDIPHREPNCVRILVDNQELDLAKVVVIGDLHSQLHDLPFLLEHAGFPGEDRVFVFNGDYVDRGAWGLETFLFLLAWKLIIRSHEGPDASDKRHDLSRMMEGYTIDHVVESGKLVTLFSAPDYPQFQATDERFNNRAAYIVLHPHDFSSPVFHTFEAVKPRPQANAYYDFEEEIDSDEELDLKTMDTGSSILTA